MSYPGAEIPTKPKRSQNDFGCALLGDVSFWRKLCRSILGAGLHHIKLFEINESDQNLPNKTFHNKIQEWAKGVLTIKCTRTLEMLPQIQRKIWLKNGKFVLCYVFRAYSS